MCILKVDEVITKDRQPSKKSQSKSTAKKSVVVADASTEESRSSSSQALRSPSKTTTADDTERETIPLEAKTSSHSSKENGRINGIIPEIKSN